MHTTVSRPRALAPLLLVAVLAVLLWPPAPAAACSCDQPTLDEVLDTQPDAAVAVVRRTDRGGSHLGTARVEHVIAGELPDQLPIEVDDGGSCKPPLAPDQVAVLTFRPNGDGWQTRDCGLIDPAAGLAEAYGPLTVDPHAAGAPALALAGGLPGVDLALLDDHLRVLATTDALPDGWYGLVACDDDHLAVRVSGTDGAGRVVLLGLPDLTVAADHELSAPDDPSWVEDVRCGADGDLQVLVAREDQRTFESTMVVETPDRDERSELATADAGRFVGDDVVLLRGAADTTRVERVRPADGTSVWRADLHGLLSDEVHVSPDRAHVALGGYGPQGPVTLVLDAADGAELARRDDGLLPLHQRAWSGPDRLVLGDQEAGYLAEARPVTDAIVDVGLRPVGDLPALAGVRVTAGPTGTVAVGSAEVTVIDRDGRRFVSDDLRLTGAGDALLLGQVLAGDPTDELDAPRDGAQAVDVPDPSPGRAPLAAAVAAAGVAAVALGAVGLRGRRAPRADRRG